MKIVVFGSTGKTGQLLVKKALQEGHEVIAYLRSESLHKLKHNHFINIHHPKLKLIEGTLDDRDKMRVALAGADVCLSALGGESRIKQSEQFTSGLATMIALMEELDVKRFIYLSMLGVGESRYFMSRFIRFVICDLLLRVPISDHTINEERIKASHLDWTIIRSGCLSDGPKSSIERHGCEQITISDSTDISRANVAQFMLKQITTNEYIKKCVWMFEA